MNEWVNDWWGWWSGYERECSLTVNAVRVGRVWYLLMNQQSNSSEVNCSNSKKILLLLCLSLSKVHDAVDSTLTLCMLSPVAVSRKRQPEMLFDSHGSSKREKGLVSLRCLWWLSIVRISYSKIYMNNLYMDWERWEVINLMRYVIIRISFISRFIHISIWYDIRNLSYLSPRYLRFGTWCSDTSHPTFEVSNPGAIVQLHFFCQITYPKWLTNGNITLRGETKRQFQ